MDGTGIQDLRLYGRCLTADEVGRLARGTRTTWLASKEPARLSAPEKDELFGSWLATSDEEYRTGIAKINSLQTEERAIQSRATVAHVMQEKPQEPMAYVLN